MGLSKVTIEKTKSEDVAVGKVISVNPKEGTSVSKDTEVTITVSIGSGDEMVSIPNVRGVKAADAQATLEKKGLIVTVEEAYDENAGVGEGEVYAQTPKAGNRVEAGTSVTIKVLNKNAASNGSGETQNGESVEAGQWATPEDVNIENQAIIRAVRYAFVWYRTEMAARVAEEKLFFLIRCLNSVKKADTM